MHTMLERRAPGALSMLGKVAQVDPEDPFPVLISTILSHRTRDERTEEATRQLFEVYATPQALARAPVRRVAQLVRPVGFYRVKARRIREVAQLLLQRFHGQVPSTYEALLTLPAVGPKTANCVLVYGFGLPAIPVDTHVHRIANRLGWATTRTPEATEAALRQLVPRRHWTQLNELFVRFGKAICKPVKPDCAVCSLKGICRYYRETSNAGPTVPPGSTRAPPVKAAARRQAVHIRLEAARSAARTSAPI
jgi:endonuclease-3